SPRCGGVGSLVHARRGWPHPRAARARGPRGMNASRHPRPAETQAPTRADVLVCALARELVDGDVVATGVSSPLALLATGVAKATHAPGCTWLACVGAIDPPLSVLHPSTEDLAYLKGRRAELTIA